MNADGAGGPRAALSLTQWQLDDLNSLIGSMVAAACATAWDQGYAAADRDDRRARECPGTTGCDCLAPTENPYEKMQRWSEEGTDE